MFLGVLGLNSDKSEVKLFGVFEDPSKAWETTRDINIEGGCAKIYLLNDNQQITPTIAKSVEKMVQQYLEKEAESEE